MRLRRIKRCHLIVRDKIFFPGVSRSVCSRIFSGGLYNIFQAEVRSRLLLLTALAARTAAAQPSPCAPRLSRAARCPQPAPRARYRPRSPGHSRRGRRSRAGLTQAFKLLPGRAGVGVSVVQGVGDEQHPLHLPGRGERGESGGRGGGGGRARSRSPTRRLLPEEALDVLLAVAQVAPSVQGGVGDQQQAPRAPHTEPSRAELRSLPSPVRPFLPRRRPRGGAVPPPLRRPGLAMLDFAIFAVTFLLILVGAVLYLYPVMLPAMGRGALGPARPGPGAGGRRASGRGAEAAPGPSQPLGPGGAPGPRPGRAVAEACGRSSGQGVPGTAQPRHSSCLTGSGMNPAFQRRGRLLALYFCRPPGQISV